MVIAFVSSRSFCEREYLGTPHELESMVDIDFPSVRTAPAGDESGRRGPEPGARDGFPTMEKTGDESGKVGIATASGVYNRRDKLGIRVTGRPSTKPVAPYHPITSITRIRPDPR
ncbi:MAG: hypothetical protein H0V00_18445 [Chloroflexia bacterium]|nr:hypothetical protein [Chloroflexia bacterium]